ncbi:MAG: hypothetical protein QOJ15_6181 [Bradyrhizobium sp.]|jgi:hypothetical protein|nr:hypothetical protein [Bradyrhizobium sp.]
MAITVLGIDLGKNSCGAVVLRRRLHRENVIKLASDLARWRLAVERTTSAASCAIRDTRSG